VKLAQSRRAPAVRSDPARGDTLPGKSILDMKQALRWAFGLVIGLLVTVVPFMYYRAQYTHAKRLRVVEPGELYRSGQMSVAGFT